MLEYQCVNPGAHDQPAATTHTETKPPAPLFACVALKNGVAVTPVTANKIQSLALADLWHASRAVGTFQQLMSEERSELRVFGKSVEVVQAALASVTAETLRPYIDAIELARCVAQAKVKASEELQSMGLDEFGCLVCLRSGAKLILVTGALRRRSLTPGTATLQFKSVALLPVTHFKALARLANYQSSDQVFAYSEDCVADLAMREKLLSLADKIARSTKVVTKEDVAVRRASRVARSAMPSKDEVEDYIVDCFGYGEDKPEHIAAATKALTGR